uniref:Lipocal-1 1 n=1 Tax=Amblyomma americanum TaxID=6943 RepID=A0A0C9RY08_AMBAM
MQLLAFFAIVGLAYATHEPEPTSHLPTQPWANEAKYGIYQDAWKSIEQSNETLYYLAKATYRNDTASWGSLFRCLSVRETRRDNETKTVWSEFIFRNASDDGKKTFNVTEEVKAISYYGYKNYTNAIQYNLGNGTNLTDPLVFSDGEICDLFYVPYADNRTGGYELWVNSKYIDNIPSCCNFILDFFAGKNRTVYNIYDKSVCNSTHIKSEK